MAWNSVSDTTPPTDRVANDTSQSPRRLTGLGADGSVGGWQERLFQPRALLARIEERYEFVEAVAAVDIYRLRAR